MATETIINLSTGERVTQERPAKPLPIAKAELWAEAKAQRDALLDAGCNVPGIGRFDTDAASRLNLAGAVLGAVMAARAQQPFSIDWKLADNTIATLDGAQMQQVGLAVLARHSAIHKRAQVLGNAIENAANANALKAVNPDTGWPA